MTSQPDEPFRRCLVPHLPTTRVGAPLTGPQLGFAGIAKPWKFERSLVAAGVELADFAPFPDHAAFAERDLAFLAERAALFDAGLVTTEKDWVRLPPAWRTRVTVWPVRARFEDEAGARALISAARVDQF